MHFITTIFATILATTAIAFPAPPLVSRDATSAVSNITSADLTSQCGTQSTGKDGSNFWAVYEVHGTMPSAQGTGAYAGGFLDNLRGKCGGIDNWQAVLDHHGGIACTFNTGHNCQTRDVSAALNAAMLGNEDWIMCTGDTWNTMLENNQEKEQEVWNYMKDVLGAVSAFLPAGAAAE